jgi:polar amino acid transport system substrate-binding protein
VAAFLPATCKKLVVPADGTLGSTHHGRGRAAPGSLSALIVCDTVAVSGEECRMLEEVPVMTGRMKWIALLGATMLTVTAVTAGCGDDNDDGDGDNGDLTPAATEPASEPTSTEGEAIDISGVEELSDGTLTFGSDIAYAPIEFYDEQNNPVGLDIDLGNALGEALGVEVEFENAGFTTLIPSLDAERYDALMSSMTVNPERQEQVDFVEYFLAGFGILVASGNPDGIETEQDLCGKIVAVQSGTVQVEYLKGTPDAAGGLDQQCKDAGQEGVTVLEFETDPEAVQALIAGQADAEMADYPVAQYSAEQTEGELVVVSNIDPAPYGIAVRKSSTALAEVLQQALDQILADGTYADILAEWNLADGSIE